MTISGLRGTSWPWEVFPKWIEDRDVISESIHRVLMTIRGERKMNNQFGSEVQLLVFENKGVVLEALSSREIGLALARHLPEVEVVNIDVIEGNKDTDPVKVDVTYEYRGQLKRTSIDVPSA